MQTRDAFVAAEARIVTDMSAAIMQIMALLGLAVALAVIVLSLYALTLFKLRGYGVAALGAPPVRLARLVAGQALWTVAAALAAAAVLASLVGALWPVYQPCNMAQPGERIGSAQLAVVEGTGYGLAGAPGGA